MKPDTSQTRVIGARQIRKGDLLIRIGGSADKDGSFKQVASVVGDRGKMQTADRKVTLEIRDTDCLTEEEEVQEALTELLKTPAENRKVKVLGPNKRGMKLVVVIVDSEDADKLVVFGRSRLALCLVQSRGELC